MSVKPTSARPNPQAAHRSAASAKATQTRLGEGNGQLRGTPDGATSGAWNKAQAVEAALDEARLTGDYAKVDKLLAGFKAYKLGNGYAPGIHPTKGKSHRWFDDNAWIGLVFMQARDQTGDRKAKSRYLAQAEHAFKFIEKGVGLGGGVHETERDPNPVYATISTGGSAELALRLYTATGKKHYLRFAERANHFLNHRLLKADGLFANNTDNRSKLTAGNGKEQVEYSYNQGVAIGTKVELYNALQKSNPKLAKAYLQQARDAAKACLAHFDTATLAGQPVIYNAIYFRNLEKLRLVSGDPKLSATIQKSLSTYANFVWNQRRVEQGRDKDLFFDVSPKTGQRETSLLASAGATQLFALQNLSAKELEAIG